MLHTDPLPAAPQRILFILASLQTSDEAEQIASLAGHLDPQLYRIEVISCFGDAVVPHSIASLLDEAGVPADTTPHHLGFEETVAYLSQIVSRHDVLVAAQDVPDVVPALNRLFASPPLIEWHRDVSQASARPGRHVRARVLTLSDPVPASLPQGVDAVFIPPLLPPARRGPVWPLSMPRPHPPVAASEAAHRWQSLFDDVAAACRPAAPPAVFRSFWQGGFECSTHRLGSGRRLDVIARTGHDRWIRQDYAQAARHGMRTVRDGLRWHLIESAAGSFDFSSFTPMLHAATHSGTQVIWDLLHFGWPDGLDIWSPGFVSRFARFAAAAGRQMREHSDDVPFWCPVNEISFFAWGAGDVGYLNPFARGRGFELKVQLARAAIAAMDELRAIDPRARFVHCEPAIAIHHLPGGPCSRAEAEAMNQQQFQALDLLSGRLWPQIGGRPEYLDILGLNYYMHNQWLHGGGAIDTDDPRYRPLSDLLFDTHARYGRPVLIAETGIEGDRRPSWLTYVAQEVARARARGVPVEGLCLYPVVNHPGWDDDRPCPNGLFEQDMHPGGRIAFAPLAETLQRLQHQMPGTIVPQRVASG